MSDNVIMATFTGGQVAKTDGLWQYDYGQILRINGLDLPQSFEVHFSNAMPRTNAKTSIGESNEVSIPDEYLISGEKIYAWVYLHSDSEDGATEYMIIIPVNRRAKPSDDPPTPQEQSVITQTIAALNDGVSRAETAAATSAQDYSTLSGVVNTLSGDLDDLSDSVSDLKSAFDALDAYVRDLSPVVTTGPSPMVSVTDAAPLDADSVIVTIEPVQAGSGDPSPENVRPITGWTQANIYREAEYDAEADPTITIDLGGTVYGGTLEWAKDGSVTLTKTRESVALSSLTWQRRSSNPYIFSASAPRYKNDVRISLHMCNLYPTVYVNAYGSAKPGILNIYRQSTGGTGVSNMIYLAFQNTVTTVNQLYEFLAETNPQYCYPLATPVTYILTPLQIAMLRGTNNLWADTGDVTLAYRQDVATLLSTLTAPDETDMTANTNYAVNSFFTVGSTLYKATAAIASGETIQPGTNCTATSIAEQLTYLNSQI